MSTDEPVQRVPLPEPDPPPSRQRVDSVVVVTDFAEETYGMAEARCSAGEDRRGAA